MYTAQGTIDRNQQIDQYIPLVRRLAHHLIAKLPASVQIDDLVQAGLIGLMDAISKFEEGQGAQFETYASQRIRGSMLDELRQADWMPRSVRQSQRKIEAAIVKAEQKYGRSPTEAEVAEVLGMPLDEYQTMLFESRGAQLVFYDDYAEDGDGEGYLDRQTEGDEESDPMSVLTDHRFREALIEQIENLPEREKMLMGLYYEQELNFREIAAVLGVTESRVCQLHTQAVTRLRSKMRQH
ncbi:MAG: RNA polymerase sigma factor FliA [Limnobacter sp.]|nr:RNA polymerase sigma factor FliA [Limnobacter sp.]